MRNIKLTFEYDGTDFFGYQRQREGRTVQGELEKALSVITDRPVTVHSAGRTDTGVHALGQVANFHTESVLSIERMLKGLNSILPGDIAVKRIEDVPDDFHARFSALSRRYEYLIDPRSLRSVFNRRFALHVPYSLDCEAIREACRYLPGEKDFSSFRCSHDASEHSVRLMIDAGVDMRGEVLALFFEGSSFLQHMIRIIVGTLLSVGRGRMTAEAFGDVISAQDRRAAGPTAPPHGLYLTHVRYPES
ncbi:MAG: tRNA pseudouridine(38-40) synthase TruA [bacterium]